MGVRFKFLSGFLILALMLLLAGSWSIHQMRDLGTSVEQLLDNNYRSITAGRRMVEALEREDTAVLLLILGKWETGRRLLDSADSTFGDNLAAASGNITVAGEETLIDEITTAYAAYKAVWARPIVDTSHEGNLEWYSGTVNPAFERVRTAVDELVALNDETMYGTASDMQNRARRAVMPGIVAILAALAFSLMFSFFVDAFFVRPLRRVTAAVDAFRESRRPFDVSATTSDEIGRLTDAVRGLCSAVSDPGKGT